MNGLERIQSTFTATKAEGRAALMPYFTTGFPNSQLSLDILMAIANAGADLIELGVPFSDPLADGPTIQHSAQVALEGGTNLKFCLEVVSELRQRGVKQPLILMSYFNPLLAYGNNLGLEKLVVDAVGCGVDGFIVPDLPVEEAGEIETVCRQHGCALIYLLAPTSTSERITVIAQRSSGFIYLVSLTGVTGARQTLPTDLKAFVERVRAETDLPLAVGFGVSTPEQARQVGNLADGVIIGSALINTVDGAADPCLAATDFVKSLWQSLEMS